MHAGLAGCDDFVDAYPVGARGLEPNRARTAPSQGAVTVTMLDELYPARRLADAAAAAAGAGLDAGLLNPGPDLRYAVGYDANGLERLPCLAAPARSDPFLVVPRLHVAPEPTSPPERP